MKKMRVAIIGQGRSGRDIHGSYFLAPKNDIVEVVAVVDALDHRRKRAAEEFKCDVYATYQELFGRKDIDLVVNASFSQDHYRVSKDLLQHGFNVLVEKPFGRNHFECEDLILTAKQNNVVIAAFHQSLYVPIFRKIKEIVESGIIGEARFINLNYSGFSRRWDWQTLQCNVAGSLYNSGPHPVGQGLALIGWPDDVKVEFAKMYADLTSGDADDSTKVIFTAPGKPIVDVEVFCSDAFPAPWTYKVVGSKGTVTGTLRTTSYKLKYIVDGENPPQPLIRESLEKPETRYPSYCSEKLITHEEEGVVEGDSFFDATDSYYRMIYKTIMEGAPLEITPQMATKVIDVISAANAMNPMPVKF